MRRNSWLAMVLLGACTGELSDDRSVGGGVVDEAHEVRYLDESAFEGGTARIVASRPFAAVGFAIDVPEGTTVEVRTLTDAAVDDGGEFVPLEPEWLEEGHQSATLRLDQPAAVVELRTSEPASFARIELSVDGELLGDLDEMDEQGHADGEVIYHTVGGMWRPSARTLRIGNEQYMPYRGATGCWSGRRLRAGARELADFLVTHFDGARSYQGYSCRRIAGSSSYSVHSTGRAIDLFIPVDGGRADNGFGDPVAAWLVEHAEYVGISYIIWDRASWGAHRARGTKHRSYGGVHPHHDHLHIELSAAAANRDTAWFREGKPHHGAGN